MDELLELIHELGLQEDDQLVFVGDLLHKGPDSEGVFETVTGLMHSYSVDLICGNHEEKHLRWLRAEQRRLETGTKNRLKHVEEYPLINITDAARDLMNNAWVANQYENYTAVHAGIPANLKELETLTHSEWMNTSSDRKKALGQVMRVRFLAGPGKTSTNSKGKTREVPEGSMLALGKQEPGDPYWADIYDGRFGTIIFGHNPFMTDKPRAFAHAYGIDLGCVHGGYLCALIADGSAVSHQVVKAARVYKERPSWVYDN